MNRLLALLDETDRTNLHRHLQPVDLEYKRSLYAPHEPIEFVYFLDEGVASLVLTLSDRHALEVGTIGNEGMVGFPALMGDRSAPNSVYIQVPGSGLRMPATTFRQELDRSPRMQIVMGKYAHAFFNQVAQSAICGHYHKIETRCCRWLLMTRDRMESDDFMLTHEFLSMMLGIRRAGVTEVAGKLQRDGMIHYEGGQVTILDRDALAARACECYFTSKDEFDRFLGENPSHNP